MKHSFVPLILSLLLSGCVMEPVKPVKMEVNEKGGKKKLTLMVYMAADNDLEAYALQNLKQMEEAVYRGINVLVLMDRAEGYDETDGNWTDTRLFEVCHDKSGGRLIVSKRLDCPGLGLSKDENTELDMANPSVLSEFIRFGISEYKAEEYALIIWGHGTGWRFAADVRTADVRAVAIDDKTGSYLSVTSLGNALRGQGLNIIGFDTCFGGVLENIYELKDCAEFSVACPGVTPAGGWNYRHLLESLYSGTFSQQNIAEAMAQSSSVPATVFINDKLDGLMEAFDLFAKSIAAEINDAGERRAVFDKLFSVKSYSYTQYPCDMYLDIPSLVNEYLNSPDQQQKLAAENLKRKIEAATCSSVTSSASGIGVHFIPLTSTHTTATTHSTYYIKNPNIADQCHFIKESSWWVPTFNGDSGSLLDKLFYKNY